MSLGPSGELSKRPFLSLLYSRSIATADSLRKCSDTLPGHPEATDKHHEDGSCELFVVALAILPYPTIQRLIVLRSPEEQMFYQPSTLSLPLQLASSKVQRLSRPAPRCACRFCF